MSEKKKVKIPDIYKRIAVYLSGYGGYPYHKKLNIKIGNYRIVRGFIYVKGIFDEYAQSCNLLYYKDKLLLKTIADSYDERVRIVFGKKEAVQFELFKSEYGKHKDDVIIPEEFVSAQVAELSPAWEKKLKEIKKCVWRTTRGYYKGPKYIS